jgi:hypothetical protein
MVTEPQHGQNCPRFGPRKGRLHDLAFPRGNGYWPAFTLHRHVQCVNSNRDQGGNKSRIRISTNPANLYSFWNGLLGRDLTPNGIKKNVAAIEKLL